MMHSWLNITSSPPLVGLAGTTLELDLPLNQSLL